MGMAAGPGPVAEEAARLFEALQRAATGWTSGAAGGAHVHADLSGAADGATRDDATPLACRTCPWCQLVAAAGRIRPETVQHLADAVSSLAAAVADVSGPRPSSSGERPGDRPWPEDRHRGTRHRGSGHEDARHSDVQHIDVTD